MAKETKKATPKEQPIDFNYEAIGWKGEGHGMVLHGRGTLGDDSFNILFSTKKVLKANLRNGAGEPITGEHRQDLMEKVTKKMVDLSTKTMDAKVKLIKAEAVGGSGNIIKYKADMEVNGEDTVVTIDYRFAPKKGTTKVASYDLHSALEGARSKVQAIGEVISGITTATN